MPNWVYTTITTNAKHEDFVKSVMGKGGLCEHYLPMPDEVRFTNSPNRIISKEEYAIKEALGQTREESHYMVAHHQTQDMVDELKAKYNAINWYEWAHLYWGTKWGDSRMEYDLDGETMYIRYQSAWSPVNHDIVEKFISELKDAEYTWEEEQGFGSQIVYEEGRVISMLEWDTPTFKYEVCMDTDMPSSIEGTFVQEVYVYLEDDYENNMGIYEAGWHASSDWNLESSMVTDKEMIDKLESLKDAKK